MKPINTRCGQKVELLNAKLGGTYSYHSFGGLNSLMFCYHLAVVAYWELFVCVSEKNTEHSTWYYGRMYNFFFKFSILELSEYGM
jgi:hypothetical protein